MTKVVKQLEAPEGLSDDDVKMALDRLISLGIIQEVKMADGEVQYCLAGDDEAVAGAFKAAGVLN